MKKILKTICGFILPLIIASIIFYLLIILSSKKDTKSDVQINTYTVTSGTIENTIQVYGNAELKKEDTLGFIMQGEVAEIFVHEGEQVSKGKILATLDTENIQNDIRQAEINLENAKINYQDLQNGGTDTQILQAENALEQSRSALRLARQQLNELEDQADNDTGGNNYDLAIQAKENEIENLRNTIRLQEKSLQDIIEGATDSQKNIAANSVQQGELTVNKAKKGLESYQIIAPFDGIIRKIDFEIGDKIYTTNPKYIYIENPDLIDISLLLDQIDIVQIKLGMPAEVEFDAYPGIIFSGIVDNIDTKANISAGVVSYNVKVHIEKGDYKILGGMTANVKIIIDRQENIIQVPTTYIQNIGEKNYITNSSGDLIEVSIGLSNNNMTQIISGLNYGDEITKEVSNKSTGLFGGMNLEEIDKKHDETMMQNMNL